MPDRELLIRAILAHPEDDRPRLLCADWLDERGESSRAEFIRVQLEMADAYDPERAESLRLRADALCKQHAANWLSDWSAGLSELGWERGFLEAATTSVGLFVQNAGRWLMREPIQRWRLHSAQLMAQALADCPGLKYVRALAIDGDEPDIGPVVRHLAKSPYVGRLHELSLPRPEVPETAIHALLSSRQLVALRHVAPFSSKPDLLKRYGWWTRRAFRARFVQT